MNGYLPHLMRLADVHEETHDVRTLRLEFLEPEAGERFQWRPGQFGQYSVFGTGECVFTIANPPTRPGHIECTFREVGKLTSALRRLSPGQVVGFRGPYGNSFPLDEWRGKDLAFVGGGIGMAALHAPLREVLDRRDEYGDLLVLNGARSVADIVYRDEMREWESIRGVRVVRTVDPGGETLEWDGEVGLIPSVFEKLAPPASNRIVVICGPPVMLRFMLVATEKLGFAPEQVLTTLENRMKCGVGQCGRCNVGPFYVCRDGPVVTAADLRRLPADV
ncbi:MAG TPA: FAD/NAD(P)-binding protein [Candidatus Eisenbacteria bacterium]|nr:FAD/NAD(P)-binding protein [Candidatus Eisenbacteria bacterium]